MKKFCNGKACFKLLLVAFAVSILSGSLMAQNLFKTTEQLWSPQKDEVYLQEVSEKVSTDKRLRALLCWITIATPLWMIKFIWLETEN